MFIELVLSEPQNFNQEELADVSRYCREVLAEDEENGEAYHFMGMMYEGGYGVNLEPKTALLYYNKAARHENSNAYIKLGMCYMNGFGVEQDMKEALKHFQKVRETHPIVLVYMG